MTTRERRPSRRSREPLSQPGGAIRSAGDPELARQLATAIRASQEEPPDSLTHGFHAYPARMHPAIARTLIPLCREGGSVLDPFCGSGTVVIESRVHGRAAIGVDLNPLAVRIGEVKSERRSERSVRAFLKSLRAVSQRSEERVRARVPVRAPISREAASWYSGHVVKELGGLYKEILCVTDESDQRAMLVLLSAISVKFSHKNADTSERRVPRRIRKGLPTEFFERRGNELADRWRALRRAMPENAPTARFIEGDVRKLASLLSNQTVDLVLTSPPYGGTYDYVDQHRLRCAWLGLDTARFQSSEIGARRDLNRANKLPQWDAQLSEALQSIAAVLSPEGLVLILIGDGQLGDRRVPADTQLDRLASRTGLKVMASASQTRPDWTSGEAREEHLIALASR